MSPAPRTELSRDLDLFTIMMVGVGAMIGAGIFVLTGLAAGTAGPALVIAFAANGVVTLLTALVYAELGSAIPEAGGGYLWVKIGLPGPNAFLAGWMSWFAHAVAGSLYALGFGAYTHLVLAEVGLQPFGLSPGLLEKGLAVLVALLFVGINFRGVSETGAASNAVTVAKVLIILLFIGSGLWVILGRPAAWDNFRPLAPTGLGGIAMAMGLTFIAFEGYEIIVQTGEEVRQPRKNIPRAVLWSLAIVIPIYMLVAFTAIGAVETGTGQPTWQWLGEHKELGLAEAARQFMPFGTVLLLVGGILSTMSALNATTYSSTRVSFAMGRDRNLPDFFARVHEARRTPHLALLASGAMIITMAVAVPIEDVAAAADVMFILLFLQVNVAVITIRRRYGDKLQYGFLIPFFPWLPVAGIVTLLGLAAFMVQYSPLAWLIVLGWIGVGGVLYYGYARGRERVAPVAPLAVREETVAGERFRVLVPVHDEADAGPVVDLAGRIARRREGEVLLLHVITVPEPTPLSAGRQYVDDAWERLVEPLQERLEAAGVDAGASIRIAHDATAAVAEEVRQSEVDLLVTGWRGRRWPPWSPLGGTLERLLRRAPCDVAVLRAADLDDLNRILVPVARPAQSGLAVALGADLAAHAGGELDLLHVVPKDLSKEDRDARIDPLLDALEDHGVGAAEAADSAHTIRIADSDHPAAQIVHDAADADLVILGASGRRRYLPWAMGAVTSRVARHSETRLLLVRRKPGVVGTLLQTVVDLLWPRSGRKTDGETG